MYRMTSITRRMPTPTPTERGSYVTILPATHVPAMSVFVHLYCHALSAGAITSEMTDMSLIRMLSAGPDVSLKGSPTVSPTTVASKCSFDVLLRPSCLAYFLALSHAPPAFDMATAVMKPLESEPIRQPARPLEDRRNPMTTGMKTASAPGMSISLMAAVVAMAMQRS